jgi:hypothetical protein
MKRISAAALCATVAAGVLTLGAPAALAAGQKKQHTKAAGVAGWIYVNANTAGANMNQVLAIPYGPTGIPNVAKTAQFTTGGAGAPFVPGKSPGTVAGDHQVLLSPSKHLLFAVNEGSNTIAVFKVNSSTGALKAVAGSPFSAGGIAPGALGFAHGTLVVANHGQDAPFNPAGGIPPGPSNLVSFHVSPTGSLTQVSATPTAPEGLIDATVSPGGKNVVTTGFYSTLIHSVTLSSSGTLTPAGAPFSFPASVTAGVVPPSFIPPFLVPLPFGVTFNPNPSDPYVYIDATVAGSMTVYKYNAAGELTFTSAAPNTASVAACWNVITNNGKYMYVANSASQNITQFDISKDGSTVKDVGLTPLPSTGTDGEMALDPTSKWLYAIGNHEDPDAPRPEGIKPNGEIVPAPLSANYLEAYKVGPGGKLTSIKSIVLPVPTANLPFGVATLQKGA